MDNKTFKRKFIKESSFNLHVKYCIASIPEVWPCFRHSISPIKKI